MDAEKCVPAQDFSIPVLKVEDPMWSYYCRVDGRILEAEMLFLSDQRSEVIHIVIIYNTCLWNA